MESERRRPTRAALLREALVLEKMRGFWEIAHVAAFTGYAQSSIRALGCPALQREAEGLSGRGRVLFDPEDVRKWYAARIRRSA